MDNNNLICPICGEPTSVWYGKARKDRLCRKHGTMLNNGEIFVDDHGRFREKSTGKILGKKEAPAAKVEEPKDEKKHEPVKESQDSANESTCIICGEPSNGKPQCRNCYSETKDFMSNLNKNSTVRQLRDYYYNLKERIYIIENLEETKKNCNKLISIAIEAMNSHEDNSLIDRVYIDVENLIKQKQKLKRTTPDKFAEEQKEKDENKVKVNTAQDGHNVDSDMEVRIDDILYTSFIIHAYGKSIDEIVEKRKKCDWYVPIVNEKGIYIEYWGMRTPKYLAERKEKEELYAKYNVPYISIEADDPKMDSLTFKSNLKREIRRLAQEYYNYVPEWLK